MHRAIPLLPPGPARRAAPFALRIGVRCAAPALALLFAACADSRLGTLDARYHVPPLPVHFRTGEDKAEVSLAAHGNDQPVLSHSRSYRERSDGRNLHLSKDTSNHLPYAGIEERIRYAREPWVVDLSLLRQEGVFYIGLSGGIAPEDPRSFHAGAFAGFAGRIGPFAWSAGAGGFRNVMRKEVRYWGYARHPILDTLIDSLFRAAPGEDSVYSPDSLRGRSADWELRANAALRWGNRVRFAPYLVAEAGMVRFWRWPAEGEDDRRVADLSLGAGAEMRPFRRVPVRAEIRYGRILLPARFRRAYAEGGLQAGWEW